MGRRYTRVTRSPFRPDGRDQRGTRPCLWCGVLRRSTSFEDRFHPACRRLKNAAAESLEGLGEGAIYTLGTLQEPPIIG